MSSKCTARELLHRHRKGCWINGLVKYLFELLHPNELLVMAVLSEVRQKMRPCLHKSILVTASVPVSTLLSSSSFSIEVYICGRSLIHENSFIFLPWEIVINIQKPICTFILILIVSSYAVTIQSGCFVIPLVPSLLFTCCVFLWCTCNCRIILTRSPNEIWCHAHLNHRNLELKSYWLSTTFRYFQVIIVFYS